MANRLHYLPILKASRRWFDFRGSFPNRFSDLEAEGSILNEQRSFNMRTERSRFAEYSGVVSHFGKSDTTLIPYSLTFGITELFSENLW